MPCPYAVVKRGARSAARRSGPLSFALKISLRALGLQLQYTAQVTMRISRHARNNMRLYGIQEQEVDDAIEVPDRTEREDRYHVVYKTFHGRFGDKPLKVVYILEDDVVLITVYPLRRAY